MKHFPIIVILATLTTVGCGQIFRSSQYPAPACGKQHPLQLVAVRFFPDPLPEARRVDQWRATIRSDATETCRTQLMVTERDKSENISIEYTVYINPGSNEVFMNGMDKYRVSGTDLCFQVLALRDGAKAPLETKENHCAKTIDKALWSMR
ncbi:MAG: hypothetical protein FJ145_20905 [Deltaproteobacteria bacterium]|nr:hypothetical protein [Deltaproteobacteria bacterium]